MLHTQAEPPSRETRVRQEGTSKELLVDATVFSDLPHVTDMHIPIIVCQGRRFWVRHNVQIEGLRAFAQSRLSVGLGGQLFETDIELPFNEADRNVLTLQGCAHKLRGVKACIWLPLGFGAGNGSNPVNAGNILRICRAIGVFPHLRSDKIEVIKQSPLVPEIKIGHRTGSYLANADVTSALQTGDDDIAFGKVKNLIAPLRPLTG